MIWKHITNLSLNIESSYKKMGYPLAPITRLIRKPMRWFYHRSPLLRHDNRFYIKPFLLKVLHSILVVTHPHDFRIYKDKLAFRSYGSFMSIQGYYVGEIEHHLVKYVTDQIKPGFTMLDIGAHHGVYTLIPAYELKSRGRKGVIYSFEPNPFNFSLLKHNVSRNALSSFVVLHNEAVSDKNCKQKLLYFPEENSDSQLESVTTMEENDTPKKIKIHSVNVIRLDNFLKKIKKVNLIKMDVQGAELFALKGGKKLISRDKPILVIEAIKNWPSTEKIKDFLIKHNYTLHGVDKNGKLCLMDSSDAFVSWDLVGLPA
jgi:FkbM family methyltransferase